MKNFKNANKHGKAFKSMIKPTFRKSELGLILIGAVAVGLINSPIADAQKSGKIVTHTISETIDESEITQQASYQLTPTLSEENSVIETPNTNLITNVNPIATVVAKAEVSTPKTKTFDEAKFNQNYNKAAKDAKGTLGDVKWYITDGVLHLGQGTLSNNQLKTNPWIVLTGEVTEENPLSAKITSISIDGNIVLAKNSQYLFAGLKNLTSIKNLTNLDTTEVSSFENMFEGDAKLAELDLSSFNTEKATTMAKMFDGMTSLKTIIFSDKFAPKQSNVKLESDLAVLPNQTTTQTWQAIGSGTIEKPAGHSLLSPVLGKNDVKLLADKYVLTGVATEEKDVSNTLKFVDKNKKQIDKDQTLTGKVGEFVKFGDKITIPTGYVSTVSGVKLDKDGSTKEVKLTKEEDQITNNLYFVLADKTKVNKEAVLITGEEGDNVDITQWIPTGYSLVDSTAASVTMGADNTDVSVTVKKDDTEEFENKVTFETEDGTKVGESQTIKGKVGDQINVTNYENKSLVPTGYKLIDEANDKVVTIVGEAGKEHVIKVVKEDSTFDVVVKYIDEDGKQLGDSFTLENAKEGEVMMIDDDFKEQSGFPDGYTTDVKSITLTSNQPEMTILVKKVAAAGSGDGDEKKDSSGTEQTVTGTDSGSTSSDGTLAETGLKKDDRSFLNILLALTLATIGITGLIKLSKREIK